MFPGSGAGMAANNHFLNTLLSSVCYQLFGSSELSLRAANLFFYGIYLAFSIWFALRCKDFILALLIFALLNLNPYWNDFFSLSRGYGLAHTLLLGSLVFLYQYYNTNKPRFLRLYIILSAGMLSAGLWLVSIAGILYFLIFLLLPVLRYMKSAKLINTKGILAACYSQIRVIPGFLHLSYLLFLLLCITYLSLLVHYNAFLFGGNTGFLYDSPGSIIANSMYLNQNLFVRYSLLSGVLILGIVSLIQLTRGIKKSITDSSGQITMLIILTVVLTFLLSVLLNLIFNIPFPRERTALYLYLLLVFFISLSFIQIGHLQNTSRILIVCYILILVWHFSSGYKKLIYFEWQKDADTKLMAVDIYNLYADKGRKFNLVTSLELEMPLKYYLERYNSDSIDISPKRINAENYKTASILLLDADDFNKLNIEKPLMIKKSYPHGGVLIIQE